MTDIDAAVAAAVENLRIASSRSRDERDELLAALRELVDAAALSSVEEIVAGWNGPPEKPYTPHPANLGASIKTTCGRMVKLAETMAKARAVIAAIERVEPEDKP